MLGGALFEGLQWPPALAQNAPGELLNTVASDLRKDIGAWVEAQLSALRTEMIAVAGSRPSSRQASERPQAEGGGGGFGGLPPSAAELSGDAYAGGSSAASALLAGGLPPARSSASDSSSSIREVLAPIAGLGQGAVEQIAAQLRADIGGIMEVAEEREKVRVSSHVERQVSGSFPTVPGSSEAEDSPAREGRRPRKQRKSTEDRDRAERGHAPEVSPYALYVQRQNSEASAGASQASGGGGTRTHASAGEVDGAEVSTLKEAVKWFESQMNELQTTLLSSRNQAVSHATAKIREEVKEWFNREVKALREITRMMVQEDEDEDDEEEDELLFAAKADAASPVSDTTDRRRSQEQSALARASVRKSKTKTEFRLEDNTTEEVIQDDGEDGEEGKKPESELERYARELRRDNNVLKGRVRPSSVKKNSVMDRGSVMMDSEMDEITKKIVSNDVLVADIMGRVRTELGLEDSAHQERRGENSRPGSRGGLAGELGGYAELSRKVNGSILELRQLDQRIANLEARDSRPQALDGVNDFNSMMGVHDDLRRLKTRFEYMERVAPPDVQKALSFFEPLHPERSDVLLDRSLEGPTMSGGASTASQSGSQWFANRIADLTLDRDSRDTFTAEDGKQLSQDVRHEVTNLSKAMRGVQREGEVNSAKIDDVQKGLGTLRRRLEEFLPQVLHALEMVLGRRAGGVPEESGGGTGTMDAAPGGAGADEAADDAGGGGTGGPGDAPAERPQQVLEGLRALLTTEGEVDTPKPFVSQKGLSRALVALQEELQAQLDELREAQHRLAKETASLNGKADTSIIRSVMEQLLEREQAPAPSEEATPPSVGRWTSPMQTIPDSPQPSAKLLQTSPPAVRLTRSMNNELKFDLKTEEQSKAFPQTHRPLTTPQHRRALNVAPPGERQVAGPRLPGPVASSLSSSFGAAPTTPAMSRVTSLPAIQGR